MRRQSKKFKERSRQAKTVRDALIARAKRCMICGASPWNPVHPFSELNQLCCHEIAGGPLRQKFLDLPYGILVLCYFCNQYEVEDKSKWPQSRQLGVLLKKSPENYDLTAFNYAVNPNAPRRIEQHEVDEWLKSDG